MDWLDHGLMPKPHSVWIALPRCSSASLSFDGLARSAALTQVDRRAGDDPPSPPDSRSPGTRWPPCNRGETLSFSDRSTHPLSWAAVVVHAPRCTSGVVDTRATSSGACAICAMADHTMVGGWYRLPPHTQCQLLIIAVKVYNVTGFSVHCGLARSCLGAFVHASLEARLHLAFMQKNILRESWIHEQLHQELVQLEQWLCWG